MPAPVSRGLPVKAIVIAVVVMFVLFVGAGVAVWLTFFPPGVYVQDSFRKVHTEIEGRIRDLGTGAALRDGVLEMLPNNGKFYSVIYKTPASENSTIETTVTWKEGDKDTFFGIICCATDQDNFTVLMLNGNSEYLINSHGKDEWYDVTGFLKLPKTLTIQKNVPYKLKIMTAGDEVSVFLNDTQLAKFLDAFPHKGRVGFYAQGGKSGRTVLAFDDFEAKKNSLFQTDEP